MIISSPSAEAHGAPTPPAGAPTFEGFATPEAPATNIVIGLANYAAADRGNLTADEQAALRAEWPEARNAVVAGDRGAYMGVHNGSQDNAPHTRTVAEGLRRGLEAAGLDGMDNTQAVEAASRAVDQVDGSLDRGNPSEHVHGAAVHLFKTGDENKALAYASDGVRIIRVRPGTEPLVVIESEIAGRRGEALGQPSFDRSHDKVRVLGVEPDDRFVMVNRDGTTFTDNSSLNAEYIANEAGKYKAPDIAADEIAKLGGNVHAYTKDDDRRPTLTPLTEDVTVAVVDAKAPESESTPLPPMPPTGKKRGIVNKLEDWTLKGVIHGQEFSRARRESRGTKLQAAREAWHNDKNFRRGVKYLGLTALGLAVSVPGAIVISRLAGGAGHDFGAHLVGADSSSSVDPTHLGAGAGGAGHSAAATAESAPHVTSPTSESALHPGAFATGAPHSATASPTESGHAHTASSPTASAHHTGSARSSAPATASATASPHAGETAGSNAGADTNHPNTDTTAGHETNPNATTAANAFTLPDGTTVDPNHLPAGVTLSDEQAKWFESSTGSGKIGEFHSTGSAPADGTWRPGTPGHIILSGLEQMGYDVNKLSEADKHAYIQHVMSSNANHHMTWQQATELSEKHVVHNPTNAEAIRTITEITAKNHGGHAILPESGSPAYEQMNALKDQVSSQASDTAHVPHAPHDPTDRTGTPATPAPNVTTAHPSTNPAPTTSATPHATTSPTGHASSGASTHASSAATSRPTSHPASHPTSHPTSHPASHATTTATADHHLGSARGGSAAATTSPASAIPHSTATSSPNTAPAPAVQPESGSNFPTYVGLIGGGALVLGGLGLIDRRRRNSRRGPAPVPGGASLPYSPAAPVPPPAPRSASAPTLRPPAPEYDDDSLGLSFFEEDDDEK